MWPLMWRVFPPMCETVYSLLGVFTVCIAKPHMVVWAHDQGSRPKAWQVVFPQGRGRNPLNDCNPAVRAPAGVVSVNTAHMFTDAVLRLEMLDRQMVPS